MNTKLLIFAFLIFSFCAKAEEKRYPVSEIPEQLLSNAKAVIRNNSREIRLNEDKTIVVSVVEAITVLNENGDNLAAFVGPYDSFIKYRSIKGKIYNKEGKAEETLKGEDILDVSNISSYSLYEDHRVKLIYPEFHEYPYTVEYSYEIVFRSHLYFPDWIIYPDYNVSVQKATLKIDVPEGFAFRMKQMNFDQTCQSSDAKGRSYTYWELEDYPALSYESYSGYLREHTPHILLSANEFELDGKAGDLSSWESIGSWIEGLYEGKDDLPETTMEQVVLLTGELKTEKEKIATLYRYMQEKVRYVNLVMGIGGLEPIPADQVDEVSYGDCKALSNYMKALLKAAGIKSYVTIVYAGSSHPRLVSDFPSFQFNHAILMVPLEKDSVWLECTSQRLPAGYLGSFTDDRKVLIITENGGVLSRTPEFNKDDNLRLLKARVIMDGNCNASIDYQKNYTGLHFGSMQSLVNRNDNVELKRAIQDRLTLSNFTVDQFEYLIDEQSEKPFVEEKVEISVHELSSIAGDYIPLDLNMLIEEISLPRRSRTRNFPVYRKRSYTSIDSVRFILPENLNVHSTPEPKNIVSKFGEYYSSVVQEENELLFVRKYVSNAGEFGKDEFSDLYSFLREVNSADNQKAMLVKN